MRSLSIKDEITEFLLYTTPEGNIKVEVILNEETVWLTQKAIAQLFDVKIPAISKHLANIYEDGELLKEATISILETVQTEGNREVKRNIENRTSFTMEAFAGSVNKFLGFNEYKILEGNGSISAKQAEEKAGLEYEKFNRTQKIERDFDKAIKQLHLKNNS